MQNLQSPIPAQIRLAAEGHCINIDESLSPVEKSYFAGYALKKAAIHLNSELHRVASALPHDDSLIKAILAVRAAIRNAGGF